MNNFRESPRNGYRISTEKEKRATRNGFLAVLAKTVNEKTGQTHTSSELAKIFDLNVETVQEILRKRGIYTFPSPEVRREELPKNEKAFFMGLGFGGYSIDRIHWGKQDFVVVGTESTKRSKKELLKQTLGAWGEVHEGAEELRIYVSPAFDFMMNLSIDAKFLDAKKRFAPFLLGMLVARLTDQEDRLSLPNENLLRAVHEKFLRHFGFNMGNLNVEKRKTKTGTLRVIEVRNPGEVFGALIGVKSVTELPFIKDLARLSSS